MEVYFFSSKISGINLYKRGSLIIIIVFTLVLVRSIGHGFNNRNIIISRRGKMDSSYALGAYLEFQGDKL